MDRKREKILRLQSDIFLGFICNCSSYFIRDRSLSHTHQVMDRLLSVLLTWRTRSGKGVGAGYVTLNSVTFRLALLLGWGGWGVVGVALLDIVTVALDTPCLLWSLVQKKNTSKIYSAL